MNSKGLTCVTVYLNAEEMKALEDRMAYLQEKHGYRKVTKSDAVRHAIMQTSYKRDKKSKGEED